MLFDGVYLGWLRIFGQLGTATIPLHVFIGALSCTPFLGFSLFMFQFQVALQQRLSKSSKTDLLTELPNRRHFIELLTANLPHQGGVLLMIDVDHFKRINDTYGHAFGDECLRKIADTLKPILPGGYHAARLGGEEFVVMLFDQNLPQAIAIGTRLARGITVCPPGLRQAIRVTNSVGASIAMPGDDPSELLSRADYALYQAKADGRARMVLSKRDATEDIVVAPAQLAG